MENAQEEDKNKMEQQVMKDITQKGGEKRETDEELKDNRDREREREAWLLDDTQHGTVQVRISLKIQKVDTKKIYKNPIEMYSYRKRNSPLS
jgi:hypothetical protein